jgi:hypothetical protein
MKAGSRKVEKVLFEHWIKVQVLKKLILFLFEGLVNQVKFGAAPSRHRTSNNNRVHFGDLIIKKSTGDFPLGIVKHS